MTLSKRRLLLCALAAFAAAGARAEFPSKPLRIVVQYQAGGSSDILARLVAEGLSKRLGQPVVVENRSGAGGIIGTDYVAKSVPDGHTLLLTVPGPVTANIVLYGKLPYDPRTDLRMVSDIATTRTVLAVHPSVPARDVASLIAVLKAAPGKYAMGSWGPGTQPHQIQVYMDRAYGLRTLHVPYKGESPMAIDLIGGVIQLTVGSIATLQPYIAAGKLRALAVAGPRRAKALPEVPTFAEQGFADEVYALTGPTSLMAPAKTPDAVVERLGREVAAVVHQPEVARRIEELGAEPVGNLPAEASAAYRAFLPVTLRLTQATGVKLD
ncbi:ABC transporter substrate-binding protein [Variovorax paradoxus]|jgi:tripartite-type tricarboxylate transporter receptor subunit TctC|uniref:Bug family tripartite tricarboxylate transporter substrate binding protein n=1 Tax=Variovorax paradoxus TaxID=34073 RepID=UPI0006E5BA04|nr:ABC transporter substrate-binding protein [Variovorax paradoxus]KPV11657.1 ABC transporter substrate-binding protein [Variovorax paradoxus]KPV13284.1 ABC transporter substrate-binding protein [Variovorax paradoxus]KPV21527.1 ABC transporter substrate-binding protein [Variovorax paradoxus]KPV32948.1 ABC transporter substrate-binding protein [Variovorax paradoxus]